MSIEARLKRSQFFTDLRRFSIGPVLLAALFAAGPLIVWTAGSAASEATPASGAGGEPGGGEEAGIATNLDLVKGVAGEAVDDLLRDLPTTRGRILIRVEPYHETAWLVEDLVGRKLRSRGLEVVTASALASATPPAASPPPETPSPEEPAGGGESSLAGAARAQAAGDSAGAEPESAGEGKDGGSEGDAGAEETPAGNGDGGGASGTGGTGETGDASETGDGGETVGGSEVAKSGAARAQPTGGGGAAAGGGTAAAAALPDADAEISLRVIELGLSYTGSHRTRPLFGKRKIERFASARLHGELRTHGDAALRWSGDGQSMVIDEVPDDAIKILEGQRYPFTAPALPTRNRGRVIEPLVVSAIVVGLVFLFVSNRS